MSEVDKGILIYYDWMESMLELEPEELKEFLRALYEYQCHRIEPPKFKGNARFISHIIFPYITRRIESSDYGKMGAVIKQAKKEAVT